MNKDSFRLVYSRTKGMMVAVEETALGMGKGRQGGTRAARRGRPAIAAQAVTLPTRWLSTPLVLAALLGMTAPAGAQIVADPSAGANRPGVIQTANGLPQVNITRPSSAGVSVNHYTQFDVNRPGAILNNSPVITTTQQAGYINGNPNLLPGGSARIIVNQVNSTSPSQLRGYLEVAGGRADVVIANPNGLLVDGAGFINTSRVTLTTGTPVYGGSGSLDAFRVTGGQISVEGAGLNAASTDQVDLIARAVKANAAIYANRLNVVAGANQVDYNALSASAIAGNGPAPAVGIDVSELGGMYANKILLASTELGVGVSNRGVLAAQAGELTLTAQGKLVLAGQTNATGNLAVSARDGIDNSGTTYSAGAASLRTDGTFSNGGTLAAQQSLGIHAQSVVSTGTLAAGLNPDGTPGPAADLTVSATGAVSATGRNLASGNATIQGASVSLAGSQTATNGNLGLTASAGNLDLTGATAAAGAALVVNAQGALVNDRGQMSSGAVTSLSAGSLSNQGGQIVSQGAMSIRSAGVVNNAGADVQAGGALNVDAGALDNTAGRLVSLNGDGLTIAVTGALTNVAGVAASGAQGGVIGGNGAVRLKAAALRNHGEVDAQTTASLDAQSLDNDQGSIVAGDAIAANTAGAVSNRQGTLSAAKVDVSAASLDNDTGRIEADALGIRTVGDLSNRGGTISQFGQTDTTIVAGGALDNAGGAFVSNGQDLSIEALSVANGGGRIALAGAGVLAVTSRGALDNTGGILQTNGALEARAGGALANTAGRIEAVGARGSLSLDAASLDNTAGRVVNVGDGSTRVRTTQDLLNAEAGLIGGNGDVQLLAGALANHGQVTAKGNASLDAQSLDNDRGSITAGQALTANVAGMASNRQGLLFGAALKLAAGSIDNEAGRVEGDEVAVRATGNLSNRGGTINQFGLSGTTAIGAGGTLDNSAGTLAANGQNLAIDANALDNADGRISHAGDGMLAVSSQSQLGNAAGVIQTNGALDVRASELDNARGTVSAQGNGKIAVQGALDNTQATLHAGSTLAIQAGGALTNADGRVEAADAHGALSLAAASIDNSGGRIVNAGDGLTRVQAQQSLRNAGAGLIGGNGDVQVVAADVANRGQITAKGDASLDAQSLDNAQGSITAGRSLNASIAGALGNRNGVLSAGAADVSAASLDNDTGRIEADALGIRIAGNLSNRGGSISQFGTADTAIRAGGTFDNTAGTLASNGRNLTVDALAVTNDGGRIAHAGDGTLAVTTEGALRNALGTILTNGRLVVRAAALDNIAGRMSAQQAAMLTLGADLINRQGVLYGQSGLEIASRGGMDNAGGTAQTGGDLSVSVDGDLSNAGGTLTANGAHGNVTVAAAGIDNRGGRVANAGDGATHIVSAGALANTGGTLGGNGDVTIAARDLANDTGAQVVAAGALKLETNRSVDNRGGRLYGGQGLTLDQAAVTFANDGGEALGGTDVRLKVAAMTNQGGAVRANQDIGVSSGSTAAGSGEMTAGRNLSLDVAGDYTNDAANKLRADGDMQIRAGGTLANTGTLAAGGSLTARGADINNAAGAVINAQATTVQADNAIVNAGRIEGDTVATSSSTLANTGAIIGNAVRVQAADVTNAGPAAVIAAAQDLKVYGTNAVSNLDGALIYSAANLQIARDGTRDPSTGLLVNQVNVLNNRSAFIEADGDIDIAARTVNNTRTSVVTEAGTPQTSTQTLTLWQAGLSGDELNTHYSYTFPGWRWNGQLSSISADQVNALRAPISVVVPKSAVANLDAATKSFSFLQAPVEQYGGAAICDATGFCSSNDQSRPLTTNPTQYYQTIQDTGSTYRITFWPDWDPAKHIRPDEVRVRYDLGPDVHDYNEISRTTTTAIATDRLVSATPAARVQAAGTIRINSDGGTILNQSSIMAAGGDLVRHAAAGEVQDVGTVLQQTVSTTDTSTFYWHQKSGGNSDTQTVPYPTVPQAPRTVDALPALATANGTVQTTAQDITINSVNRVGQTVGGSGVAGGGASGTLLDGVSGTVAGGAPLTAGTPGSVGAASGASGNAPTLGAGAVATTTGATGRPQTLGTATGGLPNLTLPTNGLYTLRPAPATPYLIETDSRFTNYKTFLSSDYMLGALGLDPQKVQKRLGDGFYEEKLVRDQVTALTGRTYLAGYTDQMDEYQALMDSGVTYAKSFGLAPGVGLSDEQMRQLTTDMVWLVAQDVTLPDGTQQSVLVPKLYLAQPNTVDLNHSGAIVAGNQVVLAASGDVNNSGRVVGDMATQVLGSNIVNRGAIGDAAGITVVQAAQDVRNLGGRIGGQDVLVRAGRDVVNETQTITEVRKIGPNGYSAGATGVGAVASIAATGNAAVLAGRDIDLVGSSVTAGNSLLLGAGRDLNVGAVALGTTQDAVSRGGQSYAHDKTITIAGSTVKAGENVTAVAGRDTVLAGSRLEAGADVSLIAGRDLAVAGLKDVSVHSEGSLGGNNASYTKASQDDTVRGSTVAGGNRVTLAAGQAPLAAGLLEATGIAAVPVDGKGSVTLIGSDVSAGTAGKTGSSVSIVASQDVTIGEAREVHDASAESRSRRSGFLSRSSSHDQSSSHVDLGVGSMVSADNVRVSAGNDLTVRQSAIAAADGVALTATQGNVLITAGQNVRESSVSHEESKSGVSAFAGAGGIGVSVGSSGGSASDHVLAVTQSDARSTVGATDGNVTILAGQDATVIGSDVITGRKDGNEDVGHIDILAKNVTIAEGIDRIARESSASSRSSGLSVALVGTPLDTANNLRDAQQNPSGVTRAKQTLSELGAAAGTTPQVAISFSNSKSSSQSSSVATISSGSSLSGAGDVRVRATGNGETDANGRALDGNILVSGSTISAGQAAVLDAARDVALRASTDTYTESNSATSSGWKISTATPSLGDIGRHIEGGPNNSGVSMVPYGSQRADASGDLASSQQNASVITGNTVGVKARTGDITIAGSGIAGEGDVTLSAAKGKIDILSGQDTLSQRSDSSSRQIGDLGGTGYAGTVGVRSESHHTDTNQATQNTIRSQVVSHTGNVAMVAGDDITARGADIAAGNDVTMIGKNVILDPGTDSASQNESHRVSQYGSTLALSGYTVQAAQAVENAARAIEDGKDARVAALYGVQAGIAALNAVSPQPVSTAETGNPSNSNGGSALVKVTASIGGGSQSSESHMQASGNQGTTVTAGNAVTIVATGSGQKDIEGFSSDGEIRGRGVQISGKDVTLAAARDVDLQSAQDVSSQTSQYSGSNASIGVGFGLGGTQNGFTLELAASQNRGNANGDAVTNQDTHVAASDTLTISSGRDTNLQGAQVAGDKIVADVGRNLNIESRQDTDTYHSKESSSGAQVSLCVPPFCAGTTVSGSASVSSGNTDSTYQSVTEQSGLYAGNGGLDVTVKGNTDLKGGVIASTADASQNKFTTGTLTTRDIENKAEYKSDSSTIAGSFSSATSGLRNLTNSAMSTAMGNAVAPSTGAASGVTHSAIAPGTVTITDNAGQLALTGKTADETVTGLNRDTANANQAIGKIFDAQQVKDQQDLRKLAGQTVQQAMPIVDKQIGEWLEDKPEAVKVAVHGLVGGLITAAVGGDFAKGAAGTAAATAAIAALNDNLGSLGMDEPTRNAVLQTVGMVVAGAVAGGGANGAAAAGAAGMADAYNRQLHPDERALARQIAAASGGKYTDQQVSDAMRVASNSKLGENVTTGMVVDGVSNPQGVYDQGASFTVPSGDGRTLVQSVPSQVDPSLASYIQSMTGGKSSAYSWNDATLGKTTGTSTGIPSNPFTPAPNGCITAECAAGLGQQGRGLLPDYAAVSGGVLSGTVGGSVNLYDGTKYLSTGVVQTNPSAISFSPGGAMSFGWIFGANNARDTNSFMNGNGNQAFVLIPTPFRVNGFAAITHSYGGATAIEFGVAPPGAISFGVMPWGNSSPIKAD